MIMNGSGKMPRSSPPTDAATEKVADPVTSDTTPHNTPSGSLPYNRFVYDDMEGIIIDNSQATGESWDPFEDEDNGDTKITIKFSLS